MNPTTQLKFASIALAIGMALQTTTSTALPATGLRPEPVAKQAGNEVDQVQWRRGRGHGWRGGRGVGWGVGAGILGGAILGSALTGPYYDRSYSYYPTTRYYGSYSGDVDSDAYCSSRFRSYDPASGTYLGYDGQRHPCP